jgi:hypothetical protein
MVILDLDLFPFPAGMARSCNCQWLGQMPFSGAGLARIWQKYFQRRLPYYAGDYCWMFSRFYVTGFRLGRFEIEKL